MVFSSVTFLFYFLPFSLLFYYLIKESYRNIFLLIASLIFYSWGEPVYIFLMIFSISINYLIGIFLAKAGKKVLAIVTLYIGIGINLGILIYFKYWNFIWENIPFLEMNMDKLDNSLPIGISFYTFQGLSYLIDTYRNKKLVQKNLVYLGLYISLFPQLVAGPIVRYTDIKEQLNKRIHSIDRFNEGIRRFVIGLAKKVIIANNMAIFADEIFQIQSTELPWIIAWLGVICYSLQIYFDFSGYSDMAIGLAKMFGFDIRENFNLPYISRSIREFWRRWHISLSNWFRDYLYIPLGGNRVSRTRTQINLLIVFVITGFWHGASWNFLIWGLIHGFFMLVERVNYGAIRIPNFLFHIYTLLIVLFSWVFFRSDDLYQSISYILAMLGYTTGNDYSVLRFVNAYNILIFILAIIFSTNASSKLNDLLLKPRLINTYRIILIIVFVFSISELATNSYNPFIYFRF